MKSLFDKHDFTIVRIGPKDAKGLSDSVSDFKNLVLGCEASYPGIDKWFEKKVLPGLRSSERTAFVGYLGAQPMVSAVIKRGDRSKFWVYPTFPTDFGGSLGVLLTTTTEPGSGLQSLDKKGGVYKVDSAAFCFLVSCSFVNRRRACGSCG